MGRVVLLDFDELPHPPDGPFRADTFLFLHGFGGDKRQLRHIAEPFAEQGARCILPSLRGHGASPAPPFGYSCLDLAADVHRLMAQIAARCHLVGYSHGALVGAVTAVAMRPGVRSLVSIDESFAAHPERMIQDEHVEARSLRWQFDWRHLLSTRAVPCLSLVARDSHMIDEEERGYLQALVGRDFQVGSIAGTHTSCLQDRNVIVRYIDDFIAGVRA